MRRLSVNRLGAGQKSGQNIPKNRCRTTIAERMVETLAELPFIGDQVVCLSHDQAGHARFWGGRTTFPSAELPFTGDQVGLFRAQPDRPKIMASLRPSGANFSIGLHP